MRSCAALLLAVLLVSCSSGSASVATIGGKSVPRDEARFVMHITAQRYAMYAGGEVNWNGIVDGLPGGELLRSLTLDALTAARVLREKTAEYGCQLTEDDEAWLIQAVAEDESDSGGAAAFDTLLKSLGGTRELYRLYQYEMAVMEDNLIYFLFGPGGPHEPDDEALEAFCETETARCSYIYLSLSGDEGPLTGELRDRQRAVAEALRREAEGNPGDFAAMVSTHGQDYVMGMNPEGMTLPKDFHGEAFRRALDALAPGEISPVVETADGLFVILRLEPDPDYLTHYRYEAEDAYRVSAYAALEERWREEIGVEVLKAFGELAP
jgi:hypothetical protein